MAVRDEVGRVLCCHGRPMTCAECGEEYAAEIDAPMATHYGAPLEVKIEKDAMVVRIGVQTLAHAVTFSDWANPYNEATGDYVRSFAIVDAPQFASDVLHEMLREREDGSTPLSDFIDRMSEAAVNDGSLGLHEDFDHRIKHGEKSPLETW